MIKETAPPITWYGDLLAQIAECGTPREALYLFIAGIAAHLGEPDRERDIIESADAAKELFVVLKRLGGIFAATILDAGATVDDAHDAHDDPPDVTLPKPHRIHT